MRIRVSDRVKIKDVPGRWRVTECDAPWYWLEPLDSCAEVLASLALDGRVGIRQRDLTPDTTDQLEIP